MRKSDDFELWATSMGCGEKLMRGNRFDDSLGGLYSTAMPMGQFDRF